jgi:predicted nucleotide-binding protein
MSSRRSSGAQSARDAGPTMLTVPAADLAERLAERIKAGWGLFNREVIDAEGVDELRDDYRTWDEYNSTLIKRSFTTDEEYGKYSGPGIAIGSPDTPQEKYKDTREDLRISIRQLASLKERLPLFEEVPSAKAAAPQAQDSALASGTEPAIFLVHGRDEGAKHGVARFVRDITGLVPIVLAEQPNLGQTVIEKFEKHASQVSYAIVLLTGDDEGRLKNTRPMKARARQNVILELGWFAGKLGRQKVAMLYETGVELPSDIVGILYAELDPAEGWKIKLAREMKAAGLPVDMNKVF